MESPQPTSPPDSYQAYIIRLWQAGSDGRWRALLQSVHTSEKMHFANLESLFTYLQAQTTDSDESIAANDCDVTSNNTDIDERNNTHNNDRNNDRDASTDDVTA
jgi:hypothetical protein